MPIKINLAALKSVSMHSDALSVLSSIAHPCKKSGHFIGRVLNGRRHVGTFNLIVGDDGAAQTNIDLAGFLEPGVGGLRQQKSPRYAVKTDGYVQFFVSSGRGQFVVELRAADKAESPKPAYSTRTLQKGDVYSTILVRPGSYSVEDTKSKKKASYVVVQPGNQKAFLDNGPLAVKCGKNGFDPKTGKVVSGKGVVFLVEDGGAVIHVDQQKDDKGRKIKGLREEAFKMPRWARPMRASDMK
ncbi:hypothetical protein ACFL12_02170 [Pseudomonadota bacterium]